MDSGPSIGDIVVWMLGPISIGVSIGTMIRAYMRHRRDAAVAREAADAMRWLKEARQLKEAHNQDPYWMGKTEEPRLLALEPLPQTIDPRLITGAINVETACKPTRKPTHENPTIERLSTAFRREGLKLENTNV